MYISQTSVALGLFHNLVELSSKYPDVVDAAKVWAINYGGNLSMAQTRAFFVALRDMPNVSEAWHAYDKLPDTFTEYDKFGTPMCFHNSLAHAIAAWNNRLR